MSDSGAFANLADIVSDVVSIQTMLDRYANANAEVLGTLAPPRLVAAETTISFKAEIVRENSRALTLDLRPLGLSAAIRHQRRSSRTMTVALTVLQRPLNPHLDLQPTIEGRTP